MAEILGHHFAMAHKIMFADSFFVVVAAFEPTTGVLLGSHSPATQNPALSGYPTLYYTICPLGIYSKRLSFGISEIKKYPIYQSICFTRLAMEIAF